MQILHAPGADDLRIDLLLACQDSLADTLNEYEITRLIVERSLRSDGERNDTPVDAVAAIALRGVLIADIGIAAQNLLAGSRLLTCGAVTRLVREYAGTEGSI